MSLNSMVDIQFYTSMRVVKQLALTLGFSLHQLFAKIIFRYIFLNVFVDLIHA